MNSLSLIRKHVAEFPTEKLENGIRLAHKNKHPREVSFTLPIRKVIFPTREGELIEEVTHLPLRMKYALSYPGTASTKSMVLFNGNGNGIFIGGRPTLEYAVIKIRRLDHRYCKISFVSRENELYFLPFNKDWKEAAQTYKKLIGEATRVPSPRTPKFFLQIGVKDHEGKAQFQHFRELLKLIKFFHSQMGSGHIIHFFGTNEAGFDRMYPDYRIAESLGGKQALKELVKEIKHLGLLTSHNYNPRIADFNWIRKNPRYWDSIIELVNGERVIEPYKGHPTCIMNPNNRLWFNKCLEVAEYLSSIGFDYVQLDQFTYQRNFYQPGKPLQEGFMQLVKEFEKRNINYWLEGVSDIFRVKPPCFYQILTRDRFELWEDGENRRGYPYGVSYPDFFMTLYPDAEVSYQLVTENLSTLEFLKKLKVATQINAAYYDLQMTYFGPQYMKLLKRVVRNLKKYA